MPDVRNCRKCGKIFNYIGGQPICPTCRDKEEEDFKRVKAYLYDNPGATLSQISTELEISAEKIKRYLREGRLEIVGDEGNFILDCEGCGKAIRSGRFCSECERSLSGDLKDTASKLNATLKPQTSGQPKSGMKYLQRDK